jgi:putative transcriptional regulator
MVINNRFGILLAEKRIAEKRRISLSEVAEQTGISRTSLQAWENNTIMRFDAPVIDALCVYFKCVPGDLIAYVDNSPYTLHPNMSEDEYQKSLKESRSE